MKVAFCLFFTLTLFFLYADAVFIEELPSDYCDGFPKSSCNRLYQPHCASDGETYPNQCYFCNAHVKSRGKITFKYYGMCKK